MPVFDNAIYQWQQGERRLREAPPERRTVLELITETLVDELRRRLGGKFFTQELVDLYGLDTSWGLHVAMRVAPKDPWAWESGVVVDAAFAKYLREATDYAGGKLVVGN
ncbi:MAG TPA: hypothetical protein VLJ42_04280 [Solirubrobacteraceae bacterium]|nr:hypothetical protein [Solirubrobacteraceae bacterium]